MVGSSGYARRSQPTICWGDHLCASLVATASRKAGYVAKRHRLGRRPRAHARWSAAAARYRRGPPWRRTSRLTVEGARPRSRLICRTDKPRATPREIHDLMRTRPFATVVAYGPDGLFANHLPLVLHAELSKHGTLRGHVTRPNPLWQSFDPAVEVLAIFQGPHSYITPTWYPSTTEHGKVVPTWNYAVVHAYGRMKTIEDLAWLRAHLEALTRQQERDREVPWAVSDAPAEFVQQTHPFGSSYRSRDLRASGRSARTVTALIGGARCTGCAPIGASSPQRWRTWSSVTAQTARRLPMAEET